MATGTIPTFACSWYEHRFNVVPFGGISQACDFVDSLEIAYIVRDRMLDRGAKLVKIYDTVDGLFY